MQFVRRHFKALIAVAMLALGAGGYVLAQSGEDDGNVGFDSASNFEVTGIEVDAEGQNAYDAQRNGWEQAQREGWRMLYARVNGGSPSGAPNLPDSALNAVVAGIIVQEEQIGPRRYVARLGVMFDRARVSQYLGTTGRINRSPPQLLIPILWVGGTPQSFEDRNEWQRAWVRYRTGDSTIDYVRPAPTGPAPLLLTVGQTNRPGRGWWRFLLDSYGASDALIPVAHIRYAYPGGPITGTFVGYHGPDRRKLGQFTLRVSRAENLPGLFDEAVRRMDRLYMRALADGRLRPDASLQFEFGIDEEELEEEFEEMEESVETVTSRNETVRNRPETVTTGSYTIQIVTPDANAVRAGESAVRSTPGVRSASTSSLAIGGVSLMQVTYIGDLDTLASALASRGFSVQRGAGTLRISRAAAPTPPPPDDPPPDEPPEDEGDEDDQ